MQLGPQPVRNDPAHAAIVVLRLLHDQGAAIRVPGGATRPTEHERRGSVTQTAVPSLVNATLMSHFAETENVLRSPMSTER